MDVFFVAVLIGIVAVSYYYMHIDFAFLFKKLLFTLNQTSPVLASTITFFTSHIAAADFIGISLFSFFSKVFFLPLPTEPYLVYAYHEGANIFAVVLLSAFFGTLAGVVNYGAGKLMRKYLFNRPSFATKLLSWVESSRFVAPLVFGAAILPVPDIASLVFGASNIGIKKFVTYTFMGLLVKGYIVLLAYEYIAPIVELVL